MKLIFQMACILHPECNFLHEYFRCQLPVEMVDVEVKVKTVQGIHTFRRDRTSQVIRCNPWSTKSLPLPHQEDENILGVGRLSPKSRPLPQTQPQQTHLQQNNPSPAQLSTNPMVRKCPGPKTNVCDKRRTMIAKRRYKVRVLTQPMPSTPTSTEPAPHCTHCQHPDTNIKVGPQQSLSQ